MNQGAQSSQEYLHQFPWGEGGQGAVGLRLCGTWALGSLVAWAGWGNSRLPYAPCTVLLLSRLPIPAGPPGCPSTAGSCRRGGASPWSTGSPHPGVDHALSRAIGPHVELRQRTHLRSNPPSPSRQALVVAMLWLCSCFYGEARGAGLCVTSAHAR